MILRPSASRTWLGENGSIMPVCSAIRRIHLSLLILIAGLLFLKLRELQILAILREFRAKTAPPPRPAAARPCRACLAPPARATPSDRGGCRGSSRDDRRRGGAWRPGPP